MINKDFFEFIEKNKEEDIINLSLRTPRSELNFDLDFALLQIENRKKNFIKLKNFISNPNFIFPDNLAPQQASHQAVAIFHSSLINSCKVLDMTAGLGIDAFTMAFNGNDVTAVELNPLKSKFLEYNAKVLGLQNFNVINADSLEVLKNSSEKFDVIFADPSRRNTENNRLYNLKDCIPDVISNQGLLLESANNVLIKASPLLDLSQTIRDFPTTTALYVVGVKGECKEILIYLNKKLFTEKASIDIFSIDLNTEGEIINLFKTERKKDSLINFPSEIPYINTNELTPGRFILEPSSLIMKIAPWKEICYKFKSKKFSPSSHLFLSDHKPDYFPGRVTRIEKLISKKDRKSFKGFPASVVSKNHPLSSEEIRKDWNLAEGNDFFIYASSIGKTKVFILTNNSQYFP